MTSRTALLASVLSALASSAPAADKVLVKVNGAPVKKSQAMERAWKAFGTQIINQMMDEILVDQAARSLGIKPDQKQVEARLGRMRAQFKDDATFQSNLSNSGLSLKDLKAQLEQQVLREALVIRAGNIEVTDDEAKNFFDTNKERLDAPESYRLRQIVVGTEKEANDFLVALRAGADFAMLASQVSLDAGTKEKGGDLGFVSRGLMSEPVLKEIQALKVGEIGGPLKTDAGFHIVKLEEVRPAKPAVFAEVKGDLKAALLADKIGKTWPTYIADLRGKAKLETSP